MVRIDRPQTPNVQAPDVRSPQKVDHAKRTVEPAKKAVTAGGDLVTISSNRSESRHPTPASSTPLGAGTSKPDVK